MKKTKFLDRKRLVKNTTSAISILIALFLVIPSAVSVQTDSETESFIGPAFASNAHTSGISVASESSGQNTQTGNLNLVDFLGYHDGYTESSWQYTAGENWECAIQLTDAQLAPYRTYEITEVLFSCGDDVYGFNNADYEIWISDQLEDPTAPPVVYGTGTSSGTGWDTVTLDMPYDIPDTGDVYLGLTWSNYDQYPAGVDEDNYVPEGFWFYYSGVWQDAAGLLGPAVWGISAGVTLGGGPAEHDIAVLGINEPNTGPAAESFPVEVTVKNTGNNSETDVPIQMLIGVATAPATDTLVEEYFEGTFPPAGWTNVLVSGDSWHRNDYYGRTNYAGGSGYCANADADSYGTGMECELWSPAFSLAGYNSAHVTFIAAYNYLSGDYADVGISTDGGSSFTNLLHWAEDHDAYGPGESVDIDISDYCGESNVIISWHYFADSWDYYYEIDDVLIEATSFGIDILYDETEYVDLAIGEILDVPFPDWEPSDWQNVENADVDYVTEATAMLPGDENPDNDQKATMFTLSYPFLHDIEVTSINAPALRGTPAQTLPVEVTIKNIGQFEECCYRTNVQIGEPIYVVDGWFSTFEADNGGFTAAGDGTWEWGEPTSGPGSAYSGSKVWATQLGGDYLNNADGKLESGVITVPTGADLTYAHWYSIEGNYDGYNVKISTDYGITWSILGSYLDPYTYASCYAAAISGETCFAGSQLSWTEVTFDLSAYESMDIMLRWHFGSDSSVPYPGAYIDDVLVGTVEVELDAEYDEDICTIVLEPGESADLTFPDWTPEDLSNYGLQDTTIAYTIVATAEDPDDTNPANDKAVEDVTLDYWHDVGIQEITSPAIGGKQPTWIQYSDETIENALGLTTAPNVITEAIKLTPDELGTYTNHEITQIRVCKGYPGYNTIHDYEVWMYTGAQPTDPDDGTIVATGTSPQDSGWFEIDTDDYAFDPTDTVWIGVNWDHHTVSTYPISMDDSIFIAGKTSWWNYNLGSGWAGFAEYAGYAMMLGVGVEEGGGGPGAPTPEIWVPVGSDSIDSIVENLGTFGETGLTAYAEILEFITNETSGTLVWDANVTGINLDPLGGEETVAFGSYGFPTQGVYGVYLELPLGSDDFTGNNQMVLGIGVDDTAPTSQHTVVPGTPDGDNGWYVSDVTVSFTADDGTEVWQSGVDHIEYKVNGGSTQTGDSVVVSADGEHTVEYRAVDNVGNEEAWNPVPTISIDQTAPVIDLTWEASGGDVIFTATCSDATSGMDRVEFFMNDVLAFTDDAEPYEWVVEWSSALELVMFKAMAYDAAGNSDFDELYGGDAVSQMQSQTTPVVRQRQTNSL